MAKLAYYASQIAPDKPHQFETPEGFRIYLSVPICRTGWQEYAGRELKSHPDYDPEWNLGDDEIVKVYRPLEVVTAPETVASFQGKPIVDGHPPEDVSVVLAENAGEYAKGHAQNVRVGSDLPDGETPLLGDLFVTSGPLNDKVDGGIRDVSCGYVYGLKRNDDATFEMTRIFGNHVAIVPKGRAGHEVSIHDSAEAVNAARAATVDAVTQFSIGIRAKPERKDSQPMKNTGFWARTFKALVASDASPEDMEEAVKRSGSDPEEEKEKEKAAKDKTTKDAEREDGMELHPDLKTACDSIGHMRDCMDKMMDHFGVGKKDAAKDAEEPKEKEGKKDDEEATTGDANVLEMEGNERGESVSPPQIGADSAELVNFLKLVKPLVGKAGEEIQKAHAAISNKVKHRSTTGNADPYAGFALLIPEAVTTDAAQDDVDPTPFFNGVPFAEGKKRYEAHLAQKGKK